MTKNNDMKPARDVRGRGFAPMRVRSKACSVIPDLIGDLALACQNIKDRSNKMLRSFLIRFCRNHFNKVQNSSGVMQGTFEVTKSLGFLVTM